MEWLDPHYAQLKISLRNPWDLKVQDVLAHNEVYDANPPPTVGKRRPGPKHPHSNIPNQQQC
jgi:hypothetical protein